VCQIGLKRSSLQHGDLRTTSNIFRLTFEYTPLNISIQYSNTMANEGEQEYQRVASKNDLQEGNLLKVEVRGKELVLSMVDGKIFAIENECTHQGGPLNEGELKGYGLKCPWHYAVFDVRNGKVSDSTVWASNLISYPVKIDEATGDILVNPNGSKL
jgi:nitrite reductase/ring-hydroxylating ferredoxin subunit